MIQMKTLLMLMVAAAALSQMPPAHAQPDMTGKQVRGFVLPEYGKDGDLQWRLKGDALFETNDRLRLTNAQLELFEDGRRSLLFTAPSCRFDRTKKIATSDDRVRVSGAHFVVEGTGFDWTGDDGRVVIRRDVRVTMSGARELLRRSRTTGGKTPGEEQKLP